MGESAVVKEKGKKVNGSVEAKRGGELREHLVPVQLWLVKYDGNWLIFLDSSAFRVGDSLVFSYWHLFPDLLVWILFPLVFPPSVSMFLTPNPYNE